MRKFGTRDKIGYMFGDFGNDFFFVSIGTFLTVFYTDVLGISGTVIGLMFLLARVWDAFTDVMMGRIVDLSKPAKDGKFRPWIRRMAVPLALSGVLLFLPVTGLPMKGRIVYAAITYIIYGMMYTAVNIPYGSMSSIMTNDPAERASLSTFRNVGSSISSALVNALIPLVCFVPVVLASGKTVEKPSGVRFFAIMLVFGAAALVCYFFCHRLCTERIKSEVMTKEEQKTGGSFKATMKGVIKNKPLIVLIVVAIILLLSQQITGTINTYVYKDYFQKSGLLSIAGLLMTVCTFALAPFISKIVGRFGKKEAIVVATTISSFFYLLLGFLHVTNVWVYLVLSLCATFGAAFFNTIVWALVLDVIDFQELTTGHRSDATIYAMYSFSRKIGQALAGGLGAFALSLVGYISSTGDQAVSQSAGTVNKIYNVATFVPGVTYLLIAVIMLFVYPLTKNKVLEITATLQSLRAKKEENNDVSAN